jgi:hypothetical protein
MNEQPTNRKSLTIIESLIFLVIIIVVVGVSIFAYHKSRQPKVINNDYSNGYLTIKAWGVKARYSGNPSLVYSIKTNKEGHSYAVFSSKQLIATEPKCGVNTNPSGAGMIERYSPNDKLLKANGAIVNGKTAAQSYDAKYNAHVGNYYYFYYQPAGDCSSLKSVQAIQGTAVFAVYDLLQKLESAN